MSDFFTPENMKRGYDLIMDTVSTNAKSRRQNRIPQIPFPIPGVPPPPREPKPKNKTVSRVKLDGVSTRTKTITKKKRKGKPKPKSLHKRVKDLEKLQSNVSQKKALETQLYKVPDGAINQSVMFEIAVMNTNTYENILSSMGLDSLDLTSKNTSARITGRFCKFEFKLNQTCNSHIEYQFFQANSNHTDQLLSRYSELYTDRTGIGLTETIVAQAAATATSSIVPAFRILHREKGEELLGLSEGTRDRWKPVSPVFKTTVGPGDVVQIKHAFPDFNYKPELEDQENTTYQKGDIWLLVRTSGGLAHDQTNKNQVMYANSGAYDVARNTYVTCHLDDGAGIRDVKQNTNYNTSGASTATFADNYVSAIEQALE